MTDEKLYKAAEERFNKHCAEDYCYPSRSDLELYKDGYKDGAKEVCKKILEEMENRALSGVSATTLRNIFKELGIEL